MTALILNFFKLELNIARKYQIKILFSAIHIACVITLFYYISKTIGIIEIFQASYFPFVASGLAFSYLAGGVINSSSNKIIEWRDMGILEGLMLSPKKPWQIYLIAGLSESLFSTLKFIFILSFILLFFLESGNFNFPLLFFVFLISFSTATCFSLIETSSLLLWKRWSLLSTISSLSALFLSGVYFPVQILPKFFHGVAQLNPFFHGLLLLRTSLGIESPDKSLASLEMSFTVMLIWLFLSFTGAVLFYKVSEGHLSKTGGHSQI